MAGILLERLAQHLDSPGLACTAVFAFRPVGRGVSGGTPDPVELRYMEIDRRSVPVIVDGCREFVEHRAGWTETALDMNSDNEIPREEYNVVAKGNVPSIELHTGGRGRPIPALDRSLASRLKSLQIRLQTRDATAVFFRKFTKGRVHMESKKIWRVFDGVLGVLEDTIIDLPGDYDCCLLGNRLAVFRRNRFEEIFGYRKFHLSAHKDVFAHLKKADVNIANFDDLLKQTRNDKRKLRKFAPIRDKGMHKWSYERIEKFLEERAVSTVRLDPKTRTVEFDSAQAMLDFYNDAHLDSKATGRRYRAQSKSRE